MAHIKVYGGTPPNSADNLCHTCRHARVTRGRTLNEEFVLCGASHLCTQRIPFKVTSCSAYADEREPTYYELLQQAWILQPGGRGRPAGFVRASDLRDADFERFASLVAADDDDD